MKQPMTTPLFKKNLHIRRTPDFPQNRHQSLDGTLCVIDRTFKSLTTRNTR